MSIDTKVIDYEINVLRNKIDSVKLFLSKHSDVNVEICKTKNTYSVYMIDNSQVNNGNKRKYVSLKSDLLNPLINIRYYKKLLPQLESELKALVKFRSQYAPEKKFEILNTIPSRFRTFVKRAEKSPQELAREWAVQPFNSNPYPFNENQSFLTHNNRRVRSKAEYIISGILDEMRLANRYEAELKINNSTFYPDFTIMHPITGKIYYLEYFGMMDNPEYMAAALKKIAAYQMSDVSDRCIFIFESQNNPMNIQSIKALLQKIFFSDPA